MGGGVQLLFCVYESEAGTPSLFNTCMDWVLGRVLDQSHVAVEHLSATPISLIFSFANDAVIFAESLEVLMMAFEALHEEAKTLGLQVSWPKTKVQMFGGLLGETIHSMYMCSEDTDILDSFKYLGSVVHNNGGSHQEVLQ